MPPMLKYLLNTVYYISVVYFTYLMILITLQYLPLNFDVSFLILKDELVNSTHYQIAFFAHVYTSILVLIAGITQFSTALRIRFKKLHRALGKVYIGLILFVASPSGLVMALYANGGNLSKLSFLLQALLWFYFTWIAFNAAKKSDWVKHKNFMLRSFALTLSAISLRLFKWTLVNTLELPPMDTYRIVAWAGWVINLSVVEIYIFWYNKNLPSNSNMSGNIN